MTTKTKTAAAEAEVINAEPKNLITILASCLVRIDGVDYSHGAELDLTDEQLKQQGIKYLFAAKMVEFVDDSKRTREYIAKIKSKSKAVEAKTLEELEQGPDFK